MKVAMQQAISLLNGGEVVAFPTETVYGLGGRIDLPKAIEKIFATKQRPFFDPLIVHVSDVIAAKKIIRQWPSLYEILSNEFWPGPLTLIAEKSETVSDMITSGLPTVGVRCPDHPVALELLQKVGAPLAAPSANRFGHTSPTEAAHVENEFLKKVPVLDGGSSQVGVESTVLRAHEKNGVWQIEILRPGGVSRQQIRDLLERKEVQYEIRRTESTASPGNLANHYQPTQPLVILENCEFRLEHLQTVLVKTAKDKLQPAELELPEEAFAAARTLYKDMRNLSQNETNLIYVIRRPHHRGEDWEAVWDRLERASSFTFRR